MSHVFPGQDDSEVVQRIIHKHLFSVLPFLLVSLALFVVGLAAVYLGASTDLSIPQADLGITKSATILIPMASIGIGIVSLSVFMFLASFYIWRQNKMVLTDENVVDIDQIGIFQKRIATLRLSRVQDIAVTVSGPMQTIFRYGTINIQTAGEKELFEFDYVPDPYAVKEFIVDLFEKFVEHTPNEGPGTTETRKVDPDTE